MTFDFFANTVTPPPIAAPPGTTLWSGGADNASNQVLADAFAGSVLTRAATFTGRTYAGTAAAPVAVLAGQRIAELVAVGTTGSTTTRVGGFAGFETTENWSTSQAGTAFAVNLNKPGTNAVVEVFRLDPATGLSMFGLNPVIDQNRIVHKRVFATLADLTTLVTAPADGMCAFIKDGADITFGAVASGGGSYGLPVFYDSASHGGAWLVG